MIESITILGEDLVSQAEVDLKSCKHSPFFDIEGKLDFE